ncbi:hypothetical protein [Sphingobium sp.]|uniref:hypothetical protein n=1 Tax=Sphingobium sp. TaxID=1912891 RepID=UPI002D19B22A|nr:hypothetical protein [Sphingobium sp.]HUD92764.1 hypothetical protein [Sphingobium sp.]
MRRLIEFFEFELAVLEAVLSRRIRSLVLLGVALIIPSLFLLVSLKASQGMPLPGLIDGFRPMLGVMALAVMFKLMWLAAQAYLKDRAALLRF